ncbi:GIY-YIG nuclease family protein [Stakelama marina]|uniref:GIY-YIG nuclease family protein n=1 Tax=Stakelama marina TaxID=2826939 RepID=A0A8T4I992_9SPHN|nr:GIY-YIG nuclease family protein [Stakelama marina]MBR0551217.1 GIY-YIG nuclease family protein [Stakelama marina]
MPFWTYILQCADGSYYVGHTDDLDARMAAHSTGTASAYTAKRRPLNLLWATNFQMRDEAFALERRLKGWSRAKKEALMRGEFHRLPALSRSTLRQAQGERRGARPV